MSIVTKIIWENSTLDFINPKKPFVVFLIIIFYVTPLHTTLNITRNGEQYYYFTDGFLFFP